jgi:hypothetical protein
MTAAGREAELCVVHLVRKANDEGAFRRFLDSYREHDAGVSHDLVLLFKGFTGDEDVEPYRRLAADVSSRSVSVADQGYDLGAYLAAAHELEYPALCFVNSFSVIQADGWLEPLATALAEPGVGLVGATGSWGSQLTYIRYDLGLGGLYAGLLGDRKRTRERLRSLATGNDEPGTLRRAIRKFDTAQEILRRCASFEPFPAHHVRTNAFLVERDVIVQVQGGRQRDKLDAFRLESGRRSLTRQIERMGFRAVVVGRDARAYERDEWPSSHTFWQGSQENLLVADNQTKAYRNADAELRTILARFAWGSAADPAEAPAMVGR